MKTTKIFALAIALIMVFALAACSDSGNNNSGGSTNTPPPSETPSVSDTSTPTPDPTPDNNDPGNGNGGDNIPDNGTPPNVEPPLESHRGDKGYFYVTTDDYIVCISPYYSNALDHSHSGNPAVYQVISFLEDGSAVNGQIKYVYETTADAEKNRWNGAFIQIDNALYPNPNPPSDAPDMMSEYYRLSWVGGKDDIINYLQNDSNGDKSWEYYVSKP